MIDMCGTERRNDKNLLDHADSALFSFPLNPHAGCETTRRKKSAALVSDPACGCMLIESGLATVTLSLLS